MTLPTTGYEIERYSDIYDRLSTNIKNDLDPLLNLKGDSTIGQVTSAYSAAIAEIYEFGAATYDSKNINAAEGAFLDNLGEYVLTPRGVATPSTGSLLITTDAAITVVAGTSFSDPNTGLSYTTDVDVSSTDDGLGVSRRRLSLSAVVNGNTYSVQIGTTLPQLYSATASAISTTETVLQELIDRINLQDPIATAVLTDATNITITLDNPTSLTNISSSQLSGQEDSVPVNITCTTNDNDEVPVGSITVIDVVQANLVSVTNLVSISIGLISETDIDYRLSIRNGATQLTNGTLDRLYLNVSDIVGVTYVLAEENDTEATVDSIPRKSFRILVDGGSDLNIANTIWKTKPAGKRPSGDSSYTILDNQGDPHVVSFQRVTHVPAVLSITVSNDADKGTTGPIPTDYIKETVINWANSNYAIGKDVVETEFYQMLYRDLSEYRFKDVVVTGSVSGIKETLSTEKAFFRWQDLTIITSVF